MHLLHTMRTEGKHHLLKINSSIAGSSINRHKYIQTIYSIYIYAHMSYNTGGYGERSRLEG